MLACNGSPAIAHFERWSWPVLSWRWRTARGSRSSFYTPSFALTSVPSDSACCWPWALGGLLGALSADRLIAQHRHRAVLLWSMGLTGGAPALLLLAPELWAAITVVVVTSGAFGVFNVAATSLRHRLVPAHVLGRIVAAWRTVVLGAGAVGALTGGLLASAQGLDAPLVLSVLLGALAVAVWWMATKPQAGVAA
jgi:predicted MFS family arabinose efflux permease